MDEGDDELEEFFGEGIHIHAVTNTRTVNTVNSSVSRPHPPPNSHGTVHHDVWREGDAWVNSGCGETLIYKATFDTIKKLQPVCIHEAHHT